MAVDLHKRQHYIYSRDNTYHDTCTYNYYVCVLRATCNWNCLHQSTSSCVMLLCMFYGLMVTVLFL